MKKLSIVLIFLALFCTPSTIEGADYLPSRETVTTIKQTVIKVKNITLTNAPFPQVLTYGGRFVVDVATFAAVFYLQPTSIFTTPLGGVALWVSGQRIKESLTSYRAWLIKKSTAPKTVESEDENAEDDIEKKKED